VPIKPPLPKWIPDGNAAFITDPGEPKRATGFIYTEKPPFQYFNWGLYNMSEWIKGLQGSFFDVIVGSTTQVSNNEATHDITQINDGTVPTTSKILILEGLHTLTANLVLTNADIMMVIEGPATVIDMATFNIQVSGDRSLLRLRVVNASVNSIQISGSGSIFEGLQMDINFLQITNGSMGKTSGLLAGIKYSDGTLSDNRVMVAKSPQTFEGQKNFPTQSLTYGANIAWDLDVGQVAQITLTGATAVLDNPSNMVNGGSYALRIVQDATGGRALTFGTAYKWVNGIAPAIPTGANQYMWISFLSNGVNMDGVGQGPFV